MTVLRAPAKLTWFLEVTGRRPDGMHLLRSEMASLELADRLTVDEADSTTLEVVGEASAGVSPGPENLVRRALALVARTARVTLDKRIPAGGGLGGGSSDAAAILRWAGVRDPDVAVGLGGDVPFCVVGGRALVEGVGEIVTPLEPAVRPVTLFLLPFAVETAACYRAYDQLISAGERPAGRNHLLTAAETVEPRLRSAREWLAAETGRPVELCGSGSTLFAEGDLGVDGSRLQSPVGTVRVLLTATEGALPVD